MNRLTHERKNGIKQGYWSPNNKQELVDRLAQYEEAAEQKSRIMTLLTETICDKYCRYPVECSNQDELDTHCNSCQLVHIWNAVMCIGPDEAETNLDKFKDINYVAEVVNKYMAQEFEEICNNSPVQVDGECPYVDEDFNVEEGKCLECTKLWLMQEYKDEGEQDANTLEI